MKLVVTNRISSFFRTSLMNDIGWILMYVVYINIVINSQLPKVCMPHEGFSHPWNLRLAVLVGHDALITNNRSEISCTDVILGP